MADSGFTVNRRHLILFIGIAVTLMLRWIASAWLNLGIDEVYYWYYSTNPRFQYFDHPPMVSWSIYLTTLGHILHSEFFVRLPSLLSWVFSGALLFHLIDKESNRWNALSFLFLFSVSTYTSIIAGTLILPDGPLLFCTSLMLYAFYALSKNQEKVWPWLLIFISMAFGHWCKYQSFIWPVALATYLILFSRRSFRNPKFYIGLSTYIILSIPLIYFNFLDSSDQISLHGNRFDLTDIEPLRLFQTLLGESLYFHPVVLIMVVLSILKIKKITPTESFLFFISVPVILAGWGLSLFDQILPHWTGPAYLPLMVLVAMRGLPLHWSKIMIWTIAIQAILLAFILVETNLGLISNRLSTEQNVYHRGTQDATLDLYGWNKLAESIHASHLNKTLVINHWYPGSHLYYYVAFQHDMDILPFGEADALHEYIRHPNYNNSIPEAAIFIESSRFPRRSRGPLQDDYEFDEVQRIPIIRRGDTIMYYFVNELHTCRK